MKETLGPGGQPISRSGSARSFNTTFGRAPQGAAPRTPSPRPSRAHLGQGCKYRLLHLWMLALPYFIMYIKVSYLLSI